MLKLVNEATCDGVHPDTGLGCVLGEHRGYHCAVDGAEWLDDE
ncbi:hypothetical protein [Kribbella qitaiheensis]|nr:hypothetical protein [Kribbella qitaiheensis]